MRSVFWCACLVAFYTLLRAGNLFCVIDSETHLRFKDVSLRPSGLNTRVSVLKTNRFLGKISHLPVNTLPNSVLCPVQAFKRLAADVPFLPNTALFSYNSKDGTVTPLSSKKFTEFLRSVLTAAGLPSSVFCPLFPSSCCLFFSGKKRFCRRP